VIVPPGPATGQATPLATFARDLVGIFDRSARADGPDVQHCRIAGAVVRLELADPALRALTRALAHLDIAPAVADFTIRIGHRATLPPPPWSWRAIRGRGEVPADDGWAVSFQDDVMSLWDRGADHAMVWLRDVASMSLAVRGSPLLHLLHAWAPARGRTLLHAAAVGGLLLVGPGGSGKSTSASVARAAGLPYVADDYCLVTDDLVESLYCSVKLFAGDGVDAPVARDASGKTLAWTTPVLRAPLRAIVVPQITGDVRAALEPLSPAAALRAVAPSTLFQLPWSGADAVARFGRLVRRYPAYRLRLGGRGDVPALLETLL
jgi:hypothetical protein